MGSPTTHYSIIKPDGTDEFLVGDFQSNYDIIDAAIFGAKTRADDAYALASGGGGGGGGTDSHQAYVWTAGSAPSAGLAASSVTPYTALRIVAPAAGRVEILLYTEYGLPANQQQEFDVTVFANGTQCDLGTSGSAAIRVPPANASGSWSIGMTTLANAVVSASGNVTITFKIAVGTGSSSYNTFRRFKCIGIWGTPGSVF